VEFGEEKDFTLVEMWCSYSGAEKSLSPMALSLGEAGDSGSGSPKRLGGVGLDMFKEWKSFCW